MKTLLLALLSLSPLCAHASWTFDVNGYSWHQSAWERAHLNHANWGGGLTYSPRPWLDLGAGWYDNSFRRHSDYLDVALLPAHLDWHGWTLRAGAMAGIVSGYTSSEVSIQPLMGGFQVNLAAPDHLVLRALIVPSAGNTTGFIGFQLGIPLRLP